MATTEPRIVHGGTPFRLKLCLVGEREVGKTALASRFALGRVEGGYRPTQETKGYRKQMGLHMDEGRYRVHLELWDAPGDPRVLNLFRTAYFHAADGILVVGDASRRGALEEMVPWIEVVRREAPRALLTLLLNKADVPRRRVQPEAAAALAKPYGVPWIFASAQANRNVDRAFVSLSAWVLQRRFSRRPREAPPPLL